MITCRVSLQLWARRIWPSASRGWAFDLLMAHAKFLDRSTVTVADVEIRARRFVIATGSSPAVPQIPGLDSGVYLTNETIFDLRERPEHLIIIGAGCVGLEMAQAFRRLGSSVTVLEGRCRSPMTIRNALPS